MEPRPEGRGDKARNAPVVQATWLQWSHGPKAVETGGCVGAPPFLDQASMEPRPEGRGDRSPPCSRGIPGPRFNGATARRPWRPVSRRICMTGKGASMEPRPEGRGDGVNPYRFSNVGLASMEPRPEGRGDGADVSGFIDSSHSLQWSHGPKAMETPSGVPNLTRTVGRFNGATARRPWRPSRGRTCP